MWCGIAGGADITCFWCCHTENAFARARWSDRPPEMAAKRAFTAAAGCLRDGSVGSTQGSLRGRGPACLSDACGRVAWFFAVIVRVSGMTRYFVFSGEAPKVTAGSQGCVVCTQPITCCGVPALNVIPDTECRVLQGRRANVRACRPARTRW